MQFGLMIERASSDEDIPLLFTVAKGDLRFSGEVWCGQKQLSQNLSRLRDFTSRMLDPGAPKRLELVFGIGEPGPACFVVLEVQRLGQIIVSTKIISLPPAISSPDLFDSALVHFSTDPASADQFAAQFDQLCSAGQGQAALRGFGTLNREIPVQ